MVLKRCASGMNRLVEARTCRPKVGYFALKKDTARGRCLCFSRFARASLLPNGDFDWGRQGDGTMQGKEANNEILQVECIVRTLETFVFCGHAVALRGKSRGSQMPA